MARRSKTFVVLISFAGLLVAGLLLGILKSGGLPTPLRAPPGTALASAGEMPGVSCQRQVVPVAVSPGDWLRFDVVGELCAVGDPDGKVLQVLVSGGGYGSIYWDFPYQPDTYSYARAALRAGYATFNFYRLGMGESDHPPGVWLSVDNQAHVLAQLIAGLTAGHEFAAVVTVGHSFGSVTSVAHALAHPEQVAGIVLTGFAHNSNPGFVAAIRKGVDAAAFGGRFAGKIVDPTYIISKPDTRGDTFYVRSNADPRVIETDELNAQTMAMGEVISAGRYFGPQSRELEVPVFVLLGEEDFVVCGGKLDCRDHAATIAYEQTQYPPAACLEMVVLEATGHNSALQLNAPANFALMLDWISRRVGAGNGVAASAPCGA